MTSKRKYVLCPRCELNYIPADDPAKKYCDVCLAELKLLDPSLLLPDDEVEQIPCPRCGVNYINPDEEMCDACRSKELIGRDVALEWEPDVDPEAESETFVAEEEEQPPLEISFDELAEEEAADQEEGAPFDEEDTFEEIDIDDDDFNELDDEEDEEL